HQIALANRLVDDLAKSVIAGGGNRGRERPTERSFGRRGRVQQNAQTGFFEELRLRWLVEHAEARGDIGLERELLQQPRAEGVNGLHLEPARRLQREREQ